MHIGEYKVKRIPGSCADDANSVSIEAVLDDPIGDILPFVNARLPGCAYNPSGKVLNWNEGEHNIVLRDRSLAISQLSDWNAATGAVERLVGFLNETWNRRDEFESRAEPHPQPTPLSVYKLLPGTNCRACGQETCFVFALKIIAREHAISDCPPLIESDMEEQRVELLTMFTSPISVVFP